MAERAICEMSKFTGRFNIQKGLLPTGSEERGVLGAGSIPVAILSSGQDINAIAL